MLLASTVALLALLPGSATALTGATEPESSAQTAPANPVEASPGEGAQADAKPSERPKPPRVDGAYIGIGLSGATTFVRTPDLATQPLWGYVQGLRIGDAVLPWMTIGIEINTGRGFNSGQTSSHGGLLVELGFLPVPRKPLSLRVGFGVGGGGVQEGDLKDQGGKRASYGGSLFKAGLRYEFFPNAHKRRPNRGGGLVLGPELGWVGFTPAGAGKGQPMSNSIHVGLWFGVYFGS